MSGSYDIIASVRTRKRGSGKGRLNFNACQTRLQVSVTKHQLRASFNPWQALPLRLIKNRFGPSEKRPGPYPCFSRGNVLRGKNLLKVFVYEQAGGHHVSQGPYCR
jgi:hypothetical protein